MVEFDDKARDEHLAALRLKEQEDVAQVLATRHGLPYADLARTQINTDALQLIDEQTARLALLAPFALSGLTVSIGTAKPEHPALKKLIDTVSRKGMTPQVYFVSENSLTKAWAAYTEVRKASKTISGVVDISEANISSIVGEVATMLDVRERISAVGESRGATRITQLIETVLGSALALKVSDIHFEPGATEIRLRFRIDGMLTEVTPIASADYRFALSRLKLLSGLKINVQHIPQDGRFSIRLGEREIEMRVSTLPGEHGESLVMRILDPEALRVEMEALGMHPQILEVLNHEIRRPHGMILNTGPTGSGKTTTLYSFLMNIRNPETKVITVEDPIEYHLGGIVQTQVSDHGLTFADGLRSILRQDPDVIMVGEIRDNDTAQIAIRASLTGHMVYSTLHTNNAAGTFPRLIDLGVSPKIIGSAVTVAMAQRLVRVLRDDCKKEVPIDGYAKDRMLSTLEGVDPALIPQTTHMYEPDQEKAKALGHASAYENRIGIFEIILMNQALDELLQKGSPSEREVQAIAKQSGMLTMEQDAVLKILQGTTSFSEVERVIVL